MSAVDPFGLAPEEAIQWFREKGYALSFDWRDVWAEQHARAFTVAKATQFDVLADIRDAVDRAIRTGRTLGDFTKQLKPTLQAKGWWGEKEATDPVTGEKKLVQLGSANRLRTIYETNLRQAQAQGRWERFERVKQRRPYGRYVAILDGNERPEHRAWHGTVLPLDDPWWQTHAPPNGWGCRCKMQQLSSSDLDRYGYSVDKEAPPSPMKTYVNDRTGQTVRVPKGIDPGFQYNPGLTPRAWMPPDDASELPAQSFRDFGRRPARVVAAEQPHAPEPWPAQVTPVMFASLFRAKDGTTGTATDPQGMQTLFSLLSLGSGRGRSSASRLPTAKSVVEDPFELWLVPVKRADRSVAYRKRYIGLYANEAVVVERGDDGFASWSTAPLASLDAQRKGTLLHAR
jgi:SPP1 gp7 family putative phage head morphogenesis protein